MISIPEAASQVASLMGNLRRPRSNASEEERSAVCNWCVDTIHRHICLVNSMCKVCFFIPPVIFVQMKLQGLHPLH